MKIAIVSNYRTSANVKTKNVFVRIRILLFVAAIFLIGCKKDRLKDDRSILAGEWKWVKTTTTHYWNPPVYTEVETPQTEGVNYFLEFLTKGKVLFSTDDKGPWRERRIVFNEFGASQNYKGFYDFEIRLNNKDEVDDYLSGRVSIDSLIIYQSPVVHYNYSNGYASPVSVFVRL